LYIFAGAGGNFRLWEDSGDTPEDCDENWAVTLCSLDWNEKQFVISPALGNLEVLPAIRNWNLRFCGFAETGLKLSVGSCYMPSKPVYDKELNRISLSVPQVPVDAEIRVEFEKAELARNDILKILFDFLDNAWIEYETKRSIFDIVRGNDIPLSALASLQSLHLPGSLYSGICEILCATV
jgi:hypothetical protein